MLISYVVSSIDLFIPNVLY